MSKISTLAEMIMKWNSLEKEFDEKRFRISTPGYSRQEIGQIEHELGYELHPSFKAVLEEVNLDHVFFDTISFGGGQNYLAGLREANSDNSAFKRDELIYRVLMAGNKIIVGIGHDLLFLLDNQRGTISALFDIEEEFSVAPDFKAFLLAMASIYYCKIKHGEPEAIPVTREWINSFNSGSDEYSSKFWQMIAQGVI